MPKQVAKVLTNRTVDSAKPEANPYHLPDAKVSGLRLRVRPSGAKFWNVVYRVNGVKSSRSLGNATIKTLTQARYEAIDILRNADNGIDVNKVVKQKRSSTLDAYIKDHYTDHAKSHMKSHKKTLFTLSKSFSDLHKKPIGDISEVDITRWRRKRQHQKKKGVTFETLKREFTSLKACLNTAVRVHKITPSHQLKDYTLKPRVDGSERSNVKAVRYLLPDEEMRLREALQAREHRMRQDRTSGREWRVARGREPLPPLPEPYVDYLQPMVLLALNTGLRRGDLFDLEWSHINLAHRQIRKVIAKTSRSNQTEPACIPLSGEAYELLKGGGTGLVFPSPKTGGRLDNISKAWGNLLTEANIDNFRFHDLRHTFASKLVMAGVDLNTVRELMTHSDIKMTLVYAHLSLDHKAAALDRAFGGARDDCVQR